MRMANYTLFFVIFYILHPYSYAKEFEIDESVYIESINSAKDKHTDVQGRHAQKTVGWLSEHSATSSSSGSGLSYSTCSDIKDFNLKRYCETGDCDQLYNVRNGSFVQLCKGKNSIHIPPGNSLDYYLKQYLDYGNADYYGLQNKIGMSYKNFKAFERVASDPNLRTMMIILWLNNIKLELQ